MTSHDTTPKPPRLAFLVLRARDIERARDFYALVGLTFERERHGKGSEHYVSDSGEGVFELYPAGEREPDARTRLGFEVDSVDATTQALAEAGFEVMTPPSDSPWGYRAEARDPDGRCVELMARG